MSPAILAYKTLPYALLHSSIMLHAIVLLMIVCQPLPRDAITACESSVYCAFVCSFGICLEIWL